MNAGINKVLMSVNGKTVIRRSTEAFNGLADEMVIVCRPEDRQAVAAEVRKALPEFPVVFTSGGRTRQESVLNGLTASENNPEDIILIHDAARCMVDRTIIESVIDSVRIHGTGIPGIPATSTFKICDENHFCVRTPDRSNLYEVQTPQGFLSGIIKPIAVKAAADGFSGTDDASLLEHYGKPVRIVAGSEKNMKLTSPQDLKIAQMLLQGVCYSMRIGMGYDVHRLVEGRKLILCGIEIPFEKGLLGHSDADVALHALMDAMLGACALGDIGQHFPDTDDRYKGISSGILLKETNKLLINNGYHVVNADITIVAQKPKLLPSVPLMINNVSSLLDVSSDRISIKATTTEKLGFEGRMEGISAYAVCMVEHS